MTKFRKFVITHKKMSLVVLVVVFILLVCATVFGLIYAQKYANSQELIKKATEQGYLSNEQINEIQGNGGLAELGTEIVNPATGETVVLSKDENGNIVETVVKDSQGNPTGNVPPSSDGHTPSPSPASTPAHSHNWVAQYTTVHHDAVYQKEIVAYNRESHDYCNVCGADVTGINPGVNSTHQCKHGCWGTYDNVIIIPVYDNVCVQNAYDEQILTGYVCSDCGARQ